ncbi:hypothetical protein L9F63_020436 [Diploptera punctata]|uniref:Chemosensory protein n=1 Tax=Diploptera punctata TaxID=6984 RepID=A0AAD8ED49_DIPPU|nr:hypothetical protein L9F63_020436 [Diploptera punctata]
MTSLCLLLLALVAIVICSPAQDRYTTKYDNIDVDGILKSERLLKNYFNCIMGRGPCTREGQLLKELIPDALSTECKKCSEVQKKQAGKVLAYVQLNHPEMFQQVLDKYDPDGTYRKKYGVDEDDEDEDKK